MDINKRRAAGLAFLIRENLCSELGAQNSGMFSLKIT